jgi:hypothetical protein
MIKALEWAAPRAERSPAGAVNARSAGQPSSMSRSIGEVVQLDAIGYSEEELLAREIKTHREAIVLYEHESRFADADLHTFARRILPQLRQHLSVLESLKSEKLNGR